MKEKDRLDDRTTDPRNERSELVRTQRKETRRGPLMLGLGGQQGPCHLVNQGAVHHHLQFACC